MLVLPKDRDDRKGLPRIVPESRGVFKAGGNHVVCGQYVWEGGAWEIELCWSCRIIY